MRIKSGRRGVGHMVGKDVISKDGIYLTKGTLEARKSKDFIIVARTDAALQ